MPIMYLARHKDPFLLYFLFHQVSSFAWVCSTNWNTVENNLAMKFCCKREQQNGALLRIGSMVESILFNS